MIFKRVFTGSWHVFGFILLSGIVFWVYFPSLYHIARADQMTFLAEYAGRDVSIQTLIDSLFYNRTREFVPGDILLFRPLCFMILSLQRFLYGYSFFWWQLTALCAHLFTVWALWRLLLRWSGDPKGLSVAAWVFTGFFAFLFVNMEAVIWHGITPYVFFAGLVLLAMERLDVFVVSKGEDVRALGACVLVMLAVVLTYEPGVWYSLCFFGYAFMSLYAAGQRDRSFLLLIPSLVYVSWSLGHWFLTGMQLDAETGRIGSSFFSMTTLGNVVQAFKWFIGNAFFLQRSDVVFDMRLTAGPGISGWAWPLFDWSSVRWLGAAVVVVLAIAAVTRRRISASDPDIRRIFLLSVMLVGYVAIITAGRLNVRSIGLDNALYYYYNFWVFFTVICFLAVRHVFEGVGKIRVLGVILAMTIAAFSVCNARDINLWASEIRGRHSAVRGFLTQIDRFIEGHRSEPDFSFSLPAEDPFSFKVSWEKKNAPLGAEYPFLALLYPKYYREEGAKYILGSVAVKRTGKDRELTGN